MTRLAPPGLALLALPAAPGAAGAAPPNPYGRRRRALPGHRDDARLRREQGRLPEHERCGGRRHRLPLQQRPLRRPRLCGDHAVGARVRALLRAADSPTAPACDRGWVHLSDHRYEARDVQHLLGLLVDQGVVRADAIGVTGISYGGIQSLNLARLRDRIRLAGESLAPWRSPNGIPLRVAAAWARWAGSDLTSSLTPNGRFLDFRATSPGQSRRPAGVMKRSYVNALYLSGSAAGFLAPPGADATADLTTWRQVTERGEPYRADVLAVARELTSFHSAAGLSGPSASLLVQNGWTDDLFPAPEALRIYRTYWRARGNSRFRVAVRRLRVELPTR